MQSELAFTHENVDPMHKYISVALLAREDCAVLRELNVLRKLVRALHLSLFDIILLIALQGWKSFEVHSHFKQQRYTADYMKYENCDQYWADAMYKSMYQMNLSSRFVRATRFLDIG